MNALRDFHLSHLTLGSKRTPSDADVQLKDEFVSVGVEQLDGIMSR